MGGAAAPALPVLRGSPAYSVMSVWFFDSRCVTATGGRRGMWLIPVGGLFPVDRVGARVLAQVMGKADLHLHTTSSDGMMSPAMLLNYVSVCTPLDLIAITDHNTLDGWERAREFQNRPENDHLQGIELVPGIEVSSRDGHILGVGVTRMVPRGLSATETVAAIHEQGGLALAPHPLAWVPGIKDFAGVGRRFMDLPFDGIETRNSTVTECVNNWRAMWLNRRQGRPQAEYGGSDAHFLWAVGRTWTEYPGQGFAALRRALAEKTTGANGYTWGAVSLLRYFHDRQRWKIFCRTHHVSLAEV